MKKKTILQVVPSMSSGGVERGVVDINEHLVKNGYNSIVLSSGGKLVYRVEKSGGKHIILDVKTKNPFTIKSNIEKISNIIVENNIDLVHVRSRAPAWSVYYACKKLNIPLVSTLHGNYSLNSIFSFFKKKYNSIMIKADRIICVSNYVKDSFFKEYDLFQKKYFLGKVNIIYRGVDTEIFKPDLLLKTGIINYINKYQVPNDKKIILLPGRFSTWKGQIYFLDVLKKLKSKDYLCIMIGDIKKNIDYVNKLKKAIVKNGLENFVKIEDDISDITSFYLLSNIVISSSIIGEPFGRVVVEAQSMKRMVVATDIGGSKETIINGKTGWLVKLDDIDGFAKTIDMVLNMSDKDREIIGNNAREHILNNFTLEKMCKETVDVYEDLLKESQNK